MATEANRIALPKPNWNAYFSSPLSGRIVAAVGIIIAWEFLIPLATDRFPIPRDVLSFMWDEVRGVTLARTSVWESFGISLRRLALGFSIALAIGVPLGLLMGMFRAVDRFFYDFVMLGLQMPYLVWALLGAMWFGIGSTAPLLVVVAAGVPFIILNVREGVANVPADLTQMARSYGVPRYEIVRHVGIPSLMPFIFAGVNYAVVQGWKALVLGEVFGAQDGAGWMIRYWYDAHRAHSLLGYALFFVILAIIMDKFVFEALSRRVFRWRPKAATGTSISRSTTS